MPAPEEPKTINALKAVQGFSAKELDDLITREVGDPMLGAFNALTKATFPGADDGLVAKVVHLMVLGYLMQRHADGGL